MESKSKSTNHHHMKKYKLRAECTQDILLFIGMIIDRVKSFSMLPMPEVPDVEFEFTLDATLEELLDCLQYIDDGHVMYQTVQPIEQYTGDRDYDRALPSEY